MKAGDQIIDIEGKPITTIEEMEEIVASHSGEEISISYIRDGVIYQKWLTSNIFKISLETMIGAQDVIYEDFYISKKLANKK
jgi:PDZ domain-containing secreted protein